MTSTFGASGVVGDYHYLLSDLGTGELLLSQTTTPEDLSISAIEAVINMDGFGGSHGHVTPVRAVVCSNDPTNFPLATIAYGTEVLVPDDTNGEWISMPLAAPLDLDADTVCWIGIHSGTPNWGGGSTANVGFGWNYVPAAAGRVWVNGAPVTYGTPPSGMDVSRVFTNDGTLIGLRAVYDPAEPSADNSWISHRHTGSKTRPRKPARTRPAQLNPRGQ